MILFYSALLHHKMNDIHHFYRCLLRVEESEITLGFRAKPQKNGIYRLEWANTKANRLIRHPPRSQIHFLKCFPEQ